MRASRWAWGVGFLVCIGGCGRPPAPGGAPRRQAPAPAPAPARAPASAAPSAAAPVASASPPTAELPRPRWTTLSNSDTCVELEPRKYSEFATFPSQAECEAWVRERACRPGFSCFDGCNWRSCDARGFGIEETLAACPPGIVIFQFDRAATKYRDSVDWAWIRDSIKERIQAPERKLLIRGYAATDEAKDTAGVRRLAKARADIVARDLVERGVPRTRMVIAVGSESDFPPYRTERSLVDVSRLPAHPVRDDFEPNTTEYRMFCGARLR